MKILTFSVDGEDISFSAEINEEVITKKFKKDRNKNVLQQIKELNEEYSTPLEEEYSTPPEWELKRMYEPREEVSYNNKMYEVLQRHISQHSWSPGKAKHLFKEV